MGVGGPESASGGRLSVEVRDHAGTPVVAPAGELDHDTADQLREVLERTEESSAGPHLVVDCSGLEFCDSTGLNVLLGARLRAEARGGAVHLVAMRPAVARVFDVTGAAAVFGVHATLDEALGSVSPS
ncbi:metal ABC transporter substrate-binding protein [Mangrovactinospora gilvigrisea]|uniref:Anti-sigma factor antagonist n=1 Tax=Mangrovactinospora gilvigrisea TaxID=1428644 RepID=A0A1J7BJ37_9ACTN|nr:STAS domain-containing protein [Mangrovactinospora gilvigrisea]OIV38597.1 metal ABC transporter substrate-binding protein [Mangrovactinospora gilvigrisea]